MQAMASNVQRSAAQGAREGIGKENMKTVITLIAPLSTLIREEGYDEPKLINALQAAANEGHGEEGKAKRSAFKGGQQVRANGELVTKDMTWRETVPFDYAVKASKVSAPLEFVKFNDSLEAHFKKCGQPSGKLTIGLVPAHLVVWLEKFHKNFKPTATESKGNGKSSTPRNGNVEQVAAPVVPA